MMDGSFTIYSPTSSHYFSTKGGMEYKNGVDLSHIQGFRKPKPKNHEFFIDMHEHLQTVIAIAKENSLSRRLYI